MLKPGIDTENRIPHPQPLPIETFSTVADKIGITRAAKVYSYLDKFGGSLQFQTGVSPATREQVGYVIGDSDHADLLPQEIFETTKAKEPVVAVLRDVARFAVAPEDDVSADDHQFLVEVLNDFVVAASSDNDQNPAIHRLADRKVRKRLFQVISRASNKDVLK